MRKEHALILVILVVTGVRLAFAQPYLSSLSVTKTSPLFTTYAAPLSRSEFVADEGYQLVWYDVVKGVNLETDNAGNLCLGVKLNDNFRYRLNQMYASPVVTTSYSDLVKYYYYPFENIRVEIFFDVYSSHIAIQDVKITNEGPSVARLSVYPFLHHTNDVITSAALVPQGDGFTFGHRERPDGWTTGHGVPYQENLVNVYIIDTVAAAFGAYPDLGTLTLRPLSTSVADYCVERGTVRHADGSSCLHRPPNAQQLILHNQSDAEVLTEMAPKWGDPEPNIPGNGYQSCELGNFRNPTIANGDSFTIVFTCSATNQQGETMGRIPSLPAPYGVRVDVQLASETAPPIPQNVQIHFSQNNASAVLSWEQVHGILYSVYRRTRSTPGRYDCIADRVNSSGHLDLGLNPDSVYGYVVIARDTLGRFSGHSVEVGNVQHSTSSFFSDVLNISLKNTIPSGPMKVVALQRNFMVAPGHTAHVRVIRGVAAADSNVHDLISQCRSLRTLDLQQLIAADEQAYDMIPRLSFSNPDYEMMYWSAFSMMRQCMLPPEGQCTYNYNVYSREPTWGWGHAGQVFHENLSMLAYAFMDPASAQHSQWVFAERMGAQPQWPAGFIPYRVGPYLNEVNYTQGEYSSSAPWFSYENWEIFKISRDTTFLLQAYDFGKRFYNFWRTERDDDRDSLCEWGGHAFWESVRDYNVIWDLLGGWADPHSANKVEALDLNCELVMEEKALASMATLLGRSEEAQQWRDRAQQRADSINRRMWDPQTRFYYHIEKHSHTFTYRNPNDLKRKEQIGLLPLWAGVANAAQASDLVQEVQNTSTFGRPYGQPLLAHNDPYGGYDAHSVYPEWNYLVFRGLLDYGYAEEARQLADRIFAGIVQVLKDRHDFYESYYCDARRPSDSWLHTYIWTGIVARMLIDLTNPPVGVEEEKHELAPTDSELEQNYPNPFNPTTVIRFKIRDSGKTNGAQLATLRIYDMLGREVATLVNEVKAPGTYVATWDARGKASGMYMCRLNAGAFVLTRKMLLLR